MKVLLHAFYKFTLSCAKHEMERFGVYVTSYIATTAPVASLTCTFGNTMRQSAGSKINSSI
ncbi:MAG: hypothetical protein IT249_07625 [Chitinophagaceae bacterium]|nr:hypothetical protein [Chitinophagaceae bacterium]